MKTKIITIVAGLIVHFIIAQPVDEVKNYKSIDVFGQTIKYIEQGKGKTLILLHGLGSNSERWIKNIDALSESYHVIALDQIGFGYSDKPTVPYRGATLVEFLNEFMIQKDIQKASLIGNSMGGWVAALFAVTHPEKLNKLVLVNPAFLLGLPNEADADEIYSFANPGTLKAMEIYIKRIYHKPMDLLDTENLKAGFTKKLSWNDGYTVYQIIKSLIAKKDLLTNDLEKIRVPTLIIHGKHDKIVPLETIYTLENLLPNNKTIIYQDSGHSPMWEEPVQFNNDVTTFLDRS